jgi:hypothetical protein
LFVFFGAKIFSNKEKRQTMSTLQAVLSISSIIVGLFISLSTLTLHQHNIPDVIITYSMTLTIALIINHFNFTSKLENLFDKIKWNIK